MRLTAAGAVDMTLHEYLLNSTQRQQDPDKASIFFVPVYLARLFNWFWTRQHCTPESADPLTCMPDANVRPLRSQIHKHRVGKTQCLRLHKALWIYSCMPACRMLMCAPCLQGHSSGKLR